MVFTLLCFFSIVLAVLYFSIKRLRDNRRPNLPPGPWPLPVLGNLLTTGDLPHRSFADLAQRYGPIMSLRLGTTLVIVASSASAAREILQKHSASVSAGQWNDAWRGGRYGDDSIFGFQPRHKWRALRRLGTERLFSPRRLDDLRQQRHDVVQELLRDVSERAARRAPVSIGRMAFATMVTLLWRFIFSTEMEEALFQEIQDMVREAVVLVSAPNVSDFFPAIAGADLQGVRRKMSRLIERLYQLIGQQIIQRVCSLENNNERKQTHDLLDAMLDMAEQGPGDHGMMMNRDVMRAFCTDLLAGASDTTSNTVEWALANLLQNSQTLRKLQEELKSVLGSRTQVEDSDIDQLPYLQAVIKETLRIHSVAPLISYRADTAIQVQGYIIPEGSNIIVNIWAIHHDAHYWSDPHTFMPERFLHNDSDFFGRNMDFIPFGSGRRICLGLPLADRMLHIILGSLVHQFEWALPEEATGNGIDMTEKFGLVLSMANPIHAIAKKR